METEIIGVLIAGTERHAILVIRDMQQSYTLNEPQGNLGQVSHKDSTQEIAVHIHKTKETGANRPDQIPLH